MAHGGKGDGWASSSSGPAPRSTIAKSALEALIANAARANARFIK